MAIAQDAFYIPDDIAIGLATGLYRRIGSIIRYATGPNKGQIVKHLSPIRLGAAEPARGLGGKSMKFAVNHGKNIRLVAISVALIGTCAWGYAEWKYREPKVLTEFRASLKAYIEAIRAGNMNVEIVDSLMNVLKELEKHRKYEKISVQLTTEEFEVLVDHIYKYTVKLAKDNSVAPTVGKMHHQSSEEGHCAIIDLPRYLVVQKSIFDETA